MAANAIPNQIFLRKGIGAIGRGPLVLVLGFKLIAGAIASCAFIGVAIGVGLT